VVLAGLLLKTGGYGLIRFVVPLFPEAAHAFTLPALALAVIGILYGAHMAFAQTDMKRLIAYTSVSHLGFVLLGVFTWNALALQGAVIQMLSHGVTTGALFVLAGILQHHLGTRDMAQMGGLWRVVPRLGAAMMFFSMAALGLPGMGNFIGEFLTLLGAYRLSIPFAAVAAAGLILALIYSLWLLDRVLYGPSRHPLTVLDLRASELAIIVILALAILWLGLAPQGFLNVSAQALTFLLRSGGAP
jgi:NADH-quinone oxidoreductase subunit M